MEPGDPRRRPPSSFDGPTLLPYPPLVRITTWAEYGVICALHLARRAGEGPIAGRDIAAREQLPADYVEQILLRLRRAGIVRSVRGAAGGDGAGGPAMQSAVRDA